MWFQKLQAVIAKHGITDYDIYNFDETGFQIGVSKDQWIITRDPRGKQYIASSSNRDYATIVEAINAAGFSIPPYIILSAQCKQWGWFDEIEPDYEVQTSETGYINDVLAYEWIQRFYNCTAKHRKGSHTLLLCDGFGSHLTYEFINFCESKNILCFFLPAHSSHFLQPLDVGVFHAYKHYHSEAVAAATRSGCEKFTRKEFLAAIGAIRKATFKPRTIKNGFAMTGIVPFNPMVVVKNLPEWCPRPNTPSDAAGTERSTGSTPKSAEKFQRYREKLDIVASYSDKMKKTLDKVIKGSVAQSIVIKELQRELADTEAASQARQRRAKASARRISEGGMISANKLAKMKRKEDQIDIEKAYKKWKTKWKKVMVELRREIKARIRKEKNQKIADRI
jgi:hypothetical protein